jgi:hypothetical protein
MVKFRRGGEKDLGEPLNRWLSYFDEHSPEGLIEEVLRMDSAIQLTQEKLEMIARETVKAVEAAREVTQGAVRKRNREIARNLKADGVPTEQIAK